MPGSNLKSKAGADFQVDQLRRDAEDRLEIGTAPPTTGWTLGTDTLTLLHRLATNPDTASDALKLLHELQVHQVELDLQHGQIESVEDEVAQTLAHYQAFYEFAPVAFFALSVDGLVIEANRAGARLFDTDQNDLRDQPIVNYFALESREEVSGLIDRLRAGATEATCKARSAPGLDRTQTLQVSASMPPHYGIVLMNVTSLI